MVALAKAKNLVYNIQFIARNAKTWLYTVLCEQRQYIALYPLTWMWYFSLGLRDCGFSPLCFRAADGEIHTTIPETGLTNRIIALFEHAVQSENGTHCPLLWRMYLNFLVRRIVSVLFWILRFLSYLDFLMNTVQYCVTKKKREY